MTSACPPTQPIEIDINHRRSEESEHLADDQSTNNRDSKRASQFRTNPGTNRQWQAAQQSSGSGHHNGPETEEAGFVNRVDRRFAFFALGIEREVNHHDGILLDNTDQ